MDLSTHSRKILTTLDKHITNERSRASDAGTDREEHGALLETTGLNKVAVAFCKKLHKMEDQDKRDDVLRSLDALRPVMEDAWGGKTKDMFDKPLYPTGESAVEPVSHLSVVPTESADDGLWDTAPEADAEPSAVDREIQEEADDFEAALAGAVAAE